MSVGNWRRWICAWWGHWNAGTWDLLTGTRSVTCLRCYSSALVVADLPSEAPKEQQP